MYWSSTTAEVPIMILAIFCSTQDNLFHSYLFTHEYHMPNLMEGGRGSFELNDLAYMWTDGSTLWEL